MVVIIEIGMNFVSIEKAYQDYINEHKQIHTKSSQTLSTGEKESLESLRTWYQGTFLAEAGLLILYYACYIWNIFEYKTY